MRPSNSSPPILNAVANPGSGTVTSAAVDARFIISATAQAVFSDSAAAGTLKLQGSNDPLPGGVAPTHWNDIANSSVVVASGATSTTPLIAANLCYEWIRVVFASTGGSGTITAILHTIGD